MSLNSISLLILFLFVISCSNDRSVYEEDEQISTVTGHTYVAKSVASWKPYSLRIIYQMNNDGSIRIEERMNSADGELKSQYFGSYSYSHPNLELTINSGCEECFNYYTASVAGDRKSFSYDIWDMSAGETKTLQFLLITD